MARISSLLLACLLAGCTASAPKQDINAAFRTGEFVAPPLALTIEGDGVSIPDGGRLPR